MKVLNKSIEMVCEFDLKGNAKPIRFRLTDENGEYQVILINGYKVEECKEEGKDFRKYTCRIKVNSIEKICELRYYKSETVWKLWKI